MTSPQSGGRPDWGIELPLLSRGRAQLSTESPVTPERLRRGWSAARVLRVSGERIEVEGGDPARPAWREAEGDAPPADAVLLGTVDGADHLAVPVPELADGVSLREAGGLVGDTDAGLVTTAVALLQWHTRGGFCPVCGLASEPEPGGWSRRCPAGHQEFPRTDAAVIVLVHDGADRMVLARQPSWPRGRYSVLAGFVEAGESLENTVRREIAEEVGIDVSGIRYLGSQPWPFPRSLMVGFAAVADPEQPLRPQDGEIEQARWVTREQVRAALRQDGWAGRVDVPQPDRPVTPDAADAPFVLPGSISIARRMIEGWAAAGDDGA